MKEALASDPFKEGLKAQVRAAAEFFERSTRALNEEDSNFSPAEGTYTVAGQVAHAAQTIDWFMAGAFDPKGFDLDFEAADKAIREVKSLAEARAWFGRAVGNAYRLIDEKSAAAWGEPLADGPVMGGLPRTSVFGGITDHTAHHRGALTVYTRLQGRQPPNPYAEG